MNGGLRPVTVYLSDEEVEALNAEASSEGRSGASAQVRYLLERRRRHPGSTSARVAAERTALQIRATLANGGVVYGSTIVGWARALDRDGAYSSDDESYADRRYDPS